MDISRKKRVWLVFILWSILLRARQALCHVTPNIVFLLADDVGTADISLKWRNKETPHLAEMATKGRLMDNLYALPVCTPSRAALLTGIYPFRYGLQRGYGDFASNGLPTSLALLPSYLSPLGYSSHMLGKWHLGHCHEKYTPTNRGFDTYLGGYSGFADHWTRMGGLPGKGKAGYDLRNGTDPSTYGSGLYSSDLYANRAVEIITSSTTPYFLYLSFNLIHAPFQDPEVKNSRHVAADLVRREMIRKLDSAVGRVMAAVEGSHARNNTVVVFMSDNGGRNYPGVRPNVPLRGEKGSIYEGGTKVPGIVFSSELEDPGTRYSGLMHIVDWLPTITRVAGRQTPPAGLDGLDQYEAIWSGRQSPRHWMVYNIDEAGSPGLATKGFPMWQIGVRSGYMKLIWGNHKMLKGKETSAKKIRLELYDLSSDPNETKNLARRWRNRNMNTYLKLLQDYAIEEAKNMVPASLDTHTFLGHPANLGGRIGSGWCQSIASNKCKTEDDELKLFTKMINSRTSRKEKSLKGNKIAQATLHGSALNVNSTKLCIISLDAE